MAEHNSTIDDLFAMAIEAEQATERLYNMLAEAFAHAPEIAGLWEQYAADEVMHAKSLAKIRQDLDEATATQPADPQALQAARNALNFSVDQAITTIITLEDAYEIVSELENAETNAVFEFLITNFSHNPEVSAFLRTQLQEHIGMLERGLPGAYRTRARREQVLAHRAASPRS
ncbi:MAG: hypothetical protein JXB35_01270 [Anaerolineae bacterium]|nr:hypothetical protein [Anaerolineae bacterium]